MEIARLAPQKRAALICLKVKQVQWRFISADPSVTPSALVFRFQFGEGRVGQQRCL